MHGGSGVGWGLATGCARTQALIRGQERVRGVQAVSRNDAFTRLRLVVEWVGEWVRGGVQRDSEAVGQWGTHQKCHLSPESCADRRRGYAPNADMISPVPCSTLFVICVEKPATAAPQWAQQCDTTEYQGSSTVV